MALSLAARQLVWIRNGLLELQQHCQYYLYTDNTGAIDNTKNPILHDRSKHIDVHHHYTREQLSIGTFHLLYVPSSDNLADILTKGLPKSNHQYLADIIQTGK